MQENLERFGSERNDGELIGICVRVVSAGTKKQIRVDRLFFARARVMIAVDFSSARGEREMIDAPFELAAVSKRSPLTEICARLACCERNSCTRATELECANILSVLLNSANELTYLTLRFQYPWKTSTFSHQLLRRTCNPDRAGDFAVGAT